MFACEIEGTSVISQPVSIRNTTIQVGCEISLLRPMFTFLRRRCSGRSNYDRRRGGSHVTNRGVESEKVHRGEEVEGRMVGLNKHRKFHDLSYRCNVGMFFNSFYPNCNVFLNLAK